MINKLIAVVVLGLLMAGGIVIISCEGPGCIGTGECTITIKQGSSGLYVDTSSDRSDCGDSATYDYNLGKYTGGCQVNNMNSTWFQNSSMRAGTHKCDC